MGEVIPINCIFPAVAAIQACRRELAEYLPSDSGVPAARCCARIRSILELHANAGPSTAMEIIRRAQDVDRNGKLGQDARINAFLRIFDSPEAERYASPDLPKLVYVDLD
jgi:hypothetical protein